MRAKRVNETQNFERGQDPKKSLNIGVVDRLSQETQDAYSAGRYGPVWDEVIAFLLGEGLDVKAIEWILRSKHMRWAADRMEPVISLDGFKAYYEKDKNYLQRDIEKKVWLNEDMGGVSGPMSTLGNTPGMGNAQPAASASTGSLDGAPKGSGDNWDSSTGIKPAVQEGLNESYTLSDFNGLEEASEIFGKFEILDVRRDPEYGYDNVYLLLIKFGDGDIGLCIYDTEKKEFIEEPSDLEDYDVTPEKLYNEYGFIVPGYEELDESLNEMNINPHDKLGVAMAQKMGIDIPFKKGKGDKDVEQKEIDEDVDLSTELVTFEEWAKQFINQ